MLDVPERFFDQFESAFPHQDTLTDPAASRLLFAKAGLANLIEYSTLSSALRIESIGLPTRLDPAASALFGGASRYLASVASMDNASVLPSDIIGGVDALGDVLAGLGVFDSVPIVGMVLNFLTGLASGIIGAIGQRETLAIEAVSMGYSKGSDQDYARQALALYGGTDLTSMFLPANDASLGVDELNVEVSVGWTGYNTVLEKAIYIPRGYGAGLGALPNTAHNPRAWQSELEARPVYQGWGAFKPAFTQGTMQSWQGLMRNSRATYLIDAVAVADAWRTWTAHMVQWASGARYGETMRHRVAGLLVSTASLGADAIAKVGGDGYRQVLPWTPQKGDGINVQPTIGDFGVWAAERQLLRRQRKFLGTLTVAYCSEGDPAFRSSPELRALLADRRALLLQHPALNQVELAQVVDPDFRQAVAVRQGPKGITDTPGGGIAGPKGITGKVPQVGAAVGGPDFANASPMLGARGVNPQSGAALLFLLSFLLK